jgi:hypothetical protein
MHSLFLDRISVEPFDVSSLRSEALMRLYREVASCREGIRVEIVAGMRSHGTRERNPASMVGLELGRPTIRFSDSLRRGERIEAIAHECIHLQLSYRHGLGVVGRRIPRYGSSEDVFHYFMSMRGDWVFLLGQIANTAHHLILIDYLRNEYGIESHLHRHLLQHNFRSIANDNGRDKESICAKGLIAFEYERLIGQFDKIIRPSSQTESFWKAYHAAQECFGRYSFQSIPASSAYEANILSFLENLGYARENFVFSPEKAFDFRDRE